MSVIGAGVKRRSEAGSALRKAALPGAWSERPSSGHDDLPACFTIASRSGCGQTGGVQWDEHDRVLEAAKHSDVLRPVVDELQVVSTARNGERLDAEVRAGNRRWWLVQFGEGTPAVLERPVTPPPPADEGVVVVVNGLSSAGKSSVIRAVVEGSDAQWVGFDEPFFGHVRPEVLIWPEQAPTVWRGFLAGISALAAEGNRVITASGGLACHQWREALPTIHMIAIAVDCPSNVLAERHRLRPDRRGDLIESTTVHDSWTYDQRYDSSVMDPEDIAKAITSLVP